jgi:hypothetical protein
MTAEDLARREPRDTPSRGDGMLLERIGRSPGDMDYVYYSLRP